MAATQAAGDRGHRWVLLDVPELSQAGAVPRLIHVNATELLLDVWLGALGGAYILYGRKQAAPIPLVCGVLLVVEPYVLKGATLQILVGGVLAALPFMRR